MRSVVLISVVLLASCANLEFTPGLLDLPPTNIRTQISLLGALMLSDLSPQLALAIAAPVVESGYWGELTSLTWWRLRYSIFSLVALWLPVLLCIMGHMASYKLKMSTVDRSRSRSTLFFGDFQLPSELETQHILAVGAPGSGKTQSIRIAMKAAQQRGEGGLVLDIGGEFTTRQFDPQLHHLLAMLDRRSQRWSPLAEIHDIGDIERVAAALVHVPTQNGDWRMMAKIFIAGCLAGLYQTGRGNNRTLLQLINRVPTDTLRKIVPADHPAQVYFFPENEKMLGSIRGTAGTACAAISGLHPSAGFNSWSITSWVKTLDTQPSWLYVPVPARIDDRAKPLASIVANFFVDAIVSLPEKNDRRVWFICDELGQYPAISALKRALTLGRKYGICAVHAVQSVSQLEAAYGLEGARTLLACYATKMLYRANCHTDAEWCAKLIGERRRPKLTQTRGRTKSASGSSFSESSTEVENIDKIVLASEIQELKNLNAWIRSGHDQPRRCVVPYVDIGEQIQPQLVLADWASFKSGGSAAKNKIKSADLTDGVPLSGDARRATEREMLNPTIAARIGDQYSQYSSEFDVLLTEEK